MLKLIKSSDWIELEHEVEELREETMRLAIDKCALELQLFKLYSGGLEKKLSDELELTSQQRSKLGLLCSIEIARLSGVPEDRILHNLEETNDYFTSEES